MLLFILLVDATEMILEIKVDILGKLLAKPIVILKSLNQQK